MIWQFTGVGPHNKGAELMFLAMRERVLEIDPDARIAMLPDTGGDYEWRSRQGLWQVLDPQQSGRLGWLRDRFFHGGYRERFGIVHQSDVDIVLDASGYAFGDPWKAEWIEATAAHYERLREQNCRVVLLPQALGPFEDPRVRNASKRIVDLADLVFARDAESLNYAREIAERPELIEQAPDFTNLLSGEVPSDWEIDAQHHVAVVPNRKMLDHGSADSRASYQSAMVHAMTASRAAGMRPFLLIHEEGDLPLAREIARDAGMPDAVFHFFDPKQLKGILGKCAYSVGSRFHGLVSCLSQGVPVIGTSWSHKYQHLFADYSASEWLARDRNGLEVALSRMVDDDERLRGAESIRRSSAGLREQAKQMWKKLDVALVS